MPDRDKRPSVRGDRRRPDNNQRSSAGRGERETPPSHTRSDEPRSPPPEVPGPTQETRPIPNDDQPSSTGTRNPLFPRSEETSSFRLASGLAPTSRNVVTSREPLEPRDMTQVNRSVSSTRPSSTKYHRDQTAAVGKASSHDNSVREEEDRRASSHVHVPGNRPSPETEGSGTYQGATVHSSQQLEATRQQNEARSTQPASSTSAAAPLRRQHSEQPPNRSHLSQESHRPEYAPHRTTSQFSNSETTVNRDALSSAPAMTVPSSRVTRTQAPRAEPPPPPFNSGLELEYRTFANIHRGEFQNVERYIRTHSRVLEEDPEALLREAVRAYDYAGTYGPTQQGDKSKYADNCIQQYVILKKLQQNAIVGRPRRVSVEAFDKFFEDLLNKTSKLRGLIHKDFDDAQARAKSQSQTGRRDAQTNITGNPPQQVQPVRVSLDQERIATSRNVFQEGISPAFSNMNLQQGGGHGSPVSGSKMPTSSAQQNQPGTGQIRRPEPNESRNYRRNTASMETRPTLDLLQPPTGVQNPNSSYVPGAQHQPLPGVTPSSGYTSSLDGNYQVRPSSYYREGRVFAMLWHESYSEPQDNGYGNSRHTLSDKVSVGLYGQRIYSSVRRMVVVREEQGCCVCIPISTYGNRGLRKFLDSPRHVQAHSIIYMDDTRATWLDGEPESSSRSIAVRKASPEQKLSPASRLCYYQPQTVQHNVRTLDVGLVTKECLPYLLGYFESFNKRR